MYHIKKNTPLILLFTSLAIIILSWFIQSHAYINPDVSWHLWVGKEILNGVKLYQDILEVNLPLIYYWAIIPNKIASWLNTTPIISETVTTNILMVMSILACYYYINKNKTLSSLQKQCYITSIVIILCIVPLCLSTNNIGQKEHKFLILTLPYITYLLANTASSLTPINIATATTAAIGFCIKPHFAIIWLTYEISQVTTNKQQIWKKWEFWLIGTIGLCYIILCLWQFPEYITQIIPIAQSAYVMNIHKTVINILAQLFFIFQPIAIPIICLLIIAFKKGSPQTIILAVATIASLCIAVIQRKGMDYQLLPMIAYLLLIAALTLPNIILKAITTWKETKKIPNNIIEMFLLIFLPITLINWVGSALYFNYNNDYSKKISQLEPLQNIIKNHKAQNSTIILAKLPHSFPLVQYNDIKWHLPMSSVWPLNTTNQEHRNQYRTIIINQIKKTNPELIIIYQNKRIDYRHLLERGTEFKQIMVNYTNIKAIESTGQTLQVWRKNKKNL